jgi:hypothetical protein
VSLAVSGRGEVLTCIIDTLATALVTGKKLAHMAKTLGVFSGSINLKRYIFG